jgi:iron(III) transport system substrate-binding protein
MKRRKILFLMALATLTSGLTIACEGNQTASNSTTPAAGASEELVVYSGRNETLVGPLIKQFEEKTGTKVQVRYGDTAELAATLQEEGQNSPADVFFAQDAGALGAISRASLASPLPDNLLNRVNERFRSDAGDWVGVTGRARTLDYNTNRVQSGELPQSILDLTDPKWRGQIGWAPTNGSFQAFVTALRVSQGDEKARQWLEGVQANEARVYPNNMSIVEAVSRGEVSLGLVNHYYLERIKAENPETPVAHHFTTDVGSLVNVAGIAILQSSQRPQLAQQFVEFMLSEEAQQYYTTETYEYPLVEGVAAPEGLQPLSQIQARYPAVDLSNLSDLNSTLKLMEETGVL